jgi:hypothetical protein
MYIESIARNFTVRPVHAPIPLGIHFIAISQPETEEEKNEAGNLLYHEFIGNLMFATIMSRPDIAYSINKMAQYSSNLN